MLFRSGNYTKIFIFEENIGMEKKINQQKTNILKQIFPHCIPQSFANFKEECDIFFKLPFSLYKIYFKMTFKFLDESVKVSCQKRQDVFYLLFQFIQN